MTHVFHPDVHTHGLQDGCAECGASAENPLAFLDDAMLGDLVRRVTGDATARSTAEAVAMDRVREALNRFGRLAKIESRALSWLPRWGVTTRWGVPIRSDSRSAQPAAAAPETPPESVGTT